MQKRMRTKVVRNQITTPTLPISEASVFDGKEYAKNKEINLKAKVNELKTLGVIPKIMVILTQRHPASELYVRLKKKKAELVGIEMEVFEVFSSRRDYRYLLNLIGVFNRDITVHGIMVQMPLAKRFKPHEKKILGVIAPQKDVDGLTENSPFIPATVKAVISIIEEATQKVLLRKPPPVFVVGSEGTVGKRLMHELKNRGYKVSGFDKRPLANWRDLWGIPSFMSLKCDVLVSATGTPGLIEARHVAKGAAVIDVGAPVGDVRFKEVKAKASFITPVPGGVGPVTIVSLLENTVEAAYNTLSLVV